MKLHLNFQQLIMEHWQGLEAFYQVAEQGSFTSAANNLDVSTSNISRQIVQLEQRLGIELVKRTTRSINLTEAGVQYYKKIKAIRQELIEATQQLQGVQETPQGLIRLTGAGGFVSKQVAPVVAEFLKLYPKVSIEMDFSNRNVNLIEEGYDLAIRFGRMQDSSLIARPLTTRHMSLVATPEFIHKFGKPKSPDELTKFNCIIAVTNRWRFNINNKIKEIKVNGNWSSNNGEALIKACLSGLGIAYLAKDLVQEYVDKNQLIYLLDEYQVSDNATWLIYPRKDLMPFRVRLLIDYLLAHFSTQ